MTSPDRPEDDVDERVLDAGLQAERTAMAWQRTGLAMTVLGALLWHAGGKGPGSLLPGVLALVAALWLLAAAPRRYRSTVRRVRAGRSPVAPGALRALAGAVVLLGVAAVGLLAVPG